MSFEVSINRGTPYPELKRSGYFHTCYVCNKNIQYDEDIYYVKAQLGLGKYHHDIPALTCSDICANMFILMMI